MRYVQYNDNKSELYAENVWGTMMNNKIYTYAVDDKISCSMHGRQ